MIVDGSGLGLVFLTAKISSLSAVEGPWLGVAITEGLTERLTDCQAIPNMSLSFSAIPLLLWSSVGQGTDHPNH
ncbi:hypothetical protein DPMN_004793 [Dreissena polymorpha]|uniref:Uncharacterized protein n=1 Tax=Dreissena polymorpha TaxID=45954 RepID=A0A9D4MSB9_DREPO|nr:hypothetical protein DPMN_004793 [Dreissena polymorpha]